MRQKFETNSDKLIYHAHLKGAALLASFGKKWWSAEEAMYHLNISGKNDLLVLVKAGAIVPNCSGSGRSISYLADSIKKYLDNPDKFKEAIKRVRLGK